MGSSKKHKRDSKKHKRRSRSRSRSPRYERSERSEHRRRSDSHSEDNNDGYGETARRHKKHRREHSEHRHQHHHSHSRQYERTAAHPRTHPEVNAVDDDSDSSDCVEVPLDEGSAPAPPPPSISRKSPAPDRVPSPPPPPQVQKRRRSPTPPPSAPKPVSSAREENDKYSRRDRYAGPITEFKEKETFKPNVKLEYIDDSGHLLTPKEAFRYLSHKFHGKGPGKNKVEKRLKKSEQEGLMKKMSSTDTPLGTLNMLQAKQKETQSPFIVLSGTKQNTSIIKQQKR
uniref:U4/U6.U5 tri-snRNP-associated protein 1 n=1 Tax=Anopheles coluzzii TaxID=1518534 RepID=A0A6E8VVJ3_ANOCL